MATITKKALVDRIADSLGTKKTLAREVVQQLLDEIVAELARGNRLEFRDFGIFETKSHAAREAQNPKTLAKIVVRAKRTAKFRAGRLMKQKLNDQTPE